MGSGSSRRAISNLGDVQIALTDIFNQLDNLTTKPQDMNKRILTGIPAPKVDLDAVNLAYLKAYVKEQLQPVIDSIPPKPVAQPPDSANTSFSKNIIPKITATYSIGSSLLIWLKGWFTHLNIDSLTASTPVKTDASKNLVSGQIGLTADVSGVLPRANGGLANNAVTAYAGTISGAVAGGTFSGTITGTANLVTGAVSGTCTGTITPGAVSGTCSTNV